MRLKRRLGDSGAAQALTQKVRGPHCREKHLPVAEQCRKGLLNSSSSFFTLFSFPLETTIDGPC